MTTEPHGTGDHETTVRALADAMRDRMRQATTNPTHRTAPIPLQLDEISVTPAASEADRAQLGKRVNDVLALGKTAVVRGWMARARAAGFAMEIRDSRCSLPRQ